MKTDPINKTRVDRVRQAFFGLFVLSLGVYAYAASTSTLFDKHLADERAYLLTVSQMPEVDAEEVSRQAEAYWDQYEDVATHEHFGRNGALGIYGARAHYQKHGRYEGRVWPE